MARHELHHTPRPPWRGRGSLIAASTAFVVVVVVAVSAGPTVIYGGPIGDGAHLTGPITGLPDPFAWRP